MRRARRGSRSKQGRWALRGSSQGLRRKVKRLCGRNRGTLGESFCLFSVRLALSTAGSRIPVVHFRAPSIDKGITALVWAVLLGAYVYFGLLAIGESGAFAFVIAAVAFAGIWLFVRLRGDDSPGA